MVRVGLVFWFFGDGAQVAVVSNPAAPTSFQTIPREAGSGKGGGRNFRPLTAFGPSNEEATRAMACFSARLPLEEFPGE